MVSVTDPAVLLTLAWLLVLFATAWRYRFGSLPPLRTLALTAVGLLWLAYSLLQLGDLLSPPYDDVLNVVALLLFLAGLSVGWRWWRAR
ncbi:uncharacterized protein HHUB_3318 [Halobacterium hubeiense]|jgi:hypothetical protein|uniref:Uncharacterized protein n=2 Tax=Halobacterium TaxID=2239 RepID=A0A0U5D0H3_9EURY|nr:hypothetical protein [Halobacterium hubeiense]CQH60888.1 uncharacterized protein HHUB_3318 [Halobacterium hubeiense]